MQPVDSFLRSVRDAFRPSDDSAGWTWAAVAACLVIAATVIVFRRLRDREAVRKSFATFLAERRVSKPQADLINRLAARAGVDAQAIAARIDVFERATAKELAKHTATATGGDEGIFGRLAALRRSLGFADIAGHFALLTTREIAPGQLVAVAGTEATVSEVNEAYLSVAAPLSSTFPVGPTGGRVRVTLVHGQEARYEARCTLLARQVGDGAQRLILGHDEQPTRIQLRKAVRVTVRGPVRLNPLGGAPLLPEGDANHAKNANDVSDAKNANEGDATTTEASDPTNSGSASLIDISVGGAALDSSVAVPVGSLVQLTFVLDGTAYRDLLALVLECSPRVRTQHMRVEFRGLSQADERQLAASVARFSAKAPT